MERTSASTAALQASPLSNDLDHVRKVAEDVASFICVSSRTASPTYTYLRTLWRHLPSAIQRQPTGCRVDPQERVRRSDGYFVRTVSSIGPEPLPSAASVLLALRTAVRTFQRPSLPRNNIYDMYRGGSLSVGDYGELDPKVRRGGFTCLPHNLAILTDSTTLNNGSMMTDIQHRHIRGFGPSAVARR